MNTQVIFIAVLAICLCDGHMWIFKPTTNRGGPDGGITAINNGQTAGGNPGHDNTGSGTAATSPCGGKAFNNAYTTPGNGGGSYQLSFIQTDVGSSWVVTSAPQPDSNLNSNKATTQQVAGASNTQHTVNIQFPATTSNLVYTVQVSPTGGASGFISCADFALAPGSGNTQSSLVMNALLVLALLAIVFLAF